MSEGDRQARLRALDPASSFCVTAPAGSGKTELLTQRILALLPTVDRPEKILAITFTRKAAAEMRGRLLDKLNEARQNVPIAAAHEKQTRTLALAAVRHADAQGWSLNPEHFNLRTIDSLCADLARQMPILSGLGGAIEVTEQDQPLFEKAVAELFNGLGNGSPADQDLRGLLLHFNNDWEAVRRLLVALLGRRGDWARSLSQHHAPESASQALLETVEMVVASVLQRLRADLEQWVDELQGLAQFAADELGQPDVALGNHPSALASWQWAAHILLTGMNEWRKPRGVTVKSGFPAQSEEKKRLQSMLEALGEGPVPQSLLELRALPIVSESDVSWLLVLRLSRLLPLLQAQLLLVFQREGRVDFTHIALAAVDALGTDEEPTDLALRLDYQIEHLLVDEFQDTSSQQFELLTKITRGWAEHNASGAKPRTAFIVGDGMQSIYGFRYADVGLFLRAREVGIGSLKLEYLELAQNFRSQAGVVNWVNEVFSRILPVRDDASRGEVSHTPAIAFHAELPDPPVNVHLFPEDDGQSEAEWLADHIASIHALEPEASVAVLVRARGHVKPLIAALQNRDLPFAARDLDKIHHSSAIMDLLSLTRWLANPADNVAALALLRAPFCGLTLADIHRLFEDQPRPFSLRAALRQAPKRLSEEAALRAGVLLSALDWAEDRRDRLSLPVWVEQVWLRLKAPCTLASNGAADALSFFELLGRAEVQGIGLDPDWLDRSLAQLYAGHSRAQAKIELMTLHKAKGLQFDYVFMPALHKATRGNNRQLLRWHYHDDGEQRRLLIAADDRLKEASTLYNYLDWLQKGRDAAEMRRLLYVGITRARHRVWLSGSCKEVADGGAGLKWPGPATPLGILRDAVEAQAVEHVSEVAQLEASSASPEAGASTLPLWRLPAAALAAQERSPDALADSHLDPRSGDQSPTTLSLTGNAVERFIGIVTHRALELLSRRPELPAFVDERLSGAIRFGLCDAGLQGNLLTQSAAAVEAMIADTLADPRGRWILAAHPGASSELQLSSRGPDGKPVLQVIDRTFIDAATGERWIIDYKTSRPASGETEAEFLTRESEHHGAQLARYRLLMEQYDPAAATIRTALYFPAGSLFLPVE